MVVRLVVLASALVCGTVGAQGLAVSTTAMSDSVWRGYSKSQGRATWALDLAWRHDAGWFASAGLLDRRAGSAAGRWEWTLAGGRRWLIEPDWVLSTSVLRYFHAGGARFDADYTDLTLAADWRGRAHAVVTLSPDTRLGTRSGWVQTWEVGWHETLPWRLALDAGVGWQGNGGIGEPSYGYGSLGLSWSSGPLRLAATRIASRAVASGAFPPSTEPSRWVLSMVLAH